MRANLVEVNRYLEDKGYELTADKNIKGMYQCDIYKHGQFTKTMKQEFKTWELAQMESAKILFNWLISQN